MILVDGSAGEGGGQILRSALALSLVTGTPFRIEGIRAGRRTPGLLRQHLTSVRAAAEISCADTSGAELGSLTLDFAPGRVRAGNYSFAIGTAGSTSLVLQTILVPLAQCGGTSIVEIEGGTHNSAAPPFDFLAQSFLPLLERTGLRIAAELIRPGFYPAGGGKIRVTIEPPAPRQALVLHERGALVSRQARAVVSNLPLDIARREIAVVAEKTGWPEESLAAHTVTGAAGPGNVLTLTLVYENVTEIVTAFGERGVRAEGLAANAVDAIRRYMKSSAPVGEHLADQLLLPLAVGAGGSFTTLRPTPHTLANIEVLRLFLGEAAPRLAGAGPEDFRVDVDGMRRGRSEN